MSGLVGSGRTESMRAIYGADPVDYKEVIIDGQKVDLKNPESAIKAGFIYMTEDRKFNGSALSLNIHENITMASLKKFSKRGVMNDKAALENADYFVKKLNIKTPGLNQKMKNLSGGNQQKVIIAKWLTQNARVIVFDEPTRGIDVGAKYEIYNIMNELSDQGIGIIMISSDLPEILGMSDRVMVFKGGKAVANIHINDAGSEKIMKYAAIENYTEEEAK